MLKPLFTATLLALLLTAGCADKTSTEALLEEAAIAIDKADYATAVTILEGLCPDETGCSDRVLALLAQARMGLAGVDTLNLLTAFNGGGGGGSTFVFDTLDAMFGMDGVTADDVAALEAAITAESNVDSPTASDNLDLALAAAAHLVASAMLAADPDNDGVWDTLTPAELDALAIIVEGDLQLLEASVAAVEAELGGGTTLTDAIRQLRTDISGGGTVTGADLSTYIGTL